MAGDIEPPFPVWQGFRHSWTYNHRLNRIGNWLETGARSGDTLEIAVGHSAASGSGRDEASFSGYHTAVRAAGVHYREIRRTIQISAREQESQAFQREIRLGRDAVPVDFDTFAAVLAGFDLWSERDADKLVSFHLATTVPRRDARTGEIVFVLLGALNVDCDSPECDNFQTTGGLIASIAAGATLGGNLGGLPGLLVGAAFGGLFAKLDITTEYTLVVRLAVIAGRSDTLCAHLSSAQNTYSWGTDEVITRAKEGGVRVELEGDHDPRWRHTVPAITQLSLEVTRQRGVLRPDTAMHLLEWDMTVIPVSSEEDRCTADVELFFRNWTNRASEFLDAQIDPPIIGDVEWLDDQVEGAFSHRDAGTATLVVGLALLQFASAEVVGQDNWSGRLIWQGGGESAASPEAVRTATRSHNIPMTADAALLAAIDGVHRIAVDHAM